MKLIPHDFTNAYNGSARLEFGGKELATLKVKVVFGIDGLEDTLALYRISKLILIL